MLPKYRGVDYGGAGAPSGLTPKGVKYVWPPRCNTHLATRNPKFWTEIDPKCSEDLFFGLHLNLGTKFRTEIELLSLTKLFKNILPPRNLRNQQKIDAYAAKYNLFSQGLKN